MGIKRDNQLVIRLTPEEKDGFERAAQIAGLGLSAWARERLRSAAIQDLQRIGDQVPFLKPIPIKPKDNGA